MTRRVHWVAYGSVQGVGFRAYTLHHARKLDLCGRVWNRADGAVEVEASGDPDAIDRLHDLLLAGPPYAAVSRVEPLRPGVERLPCPFEIGY
jgi:acylphosphatase